MPDGSAAILLDRPEGRAVCSNCGAHVRCRIGLATIGGMCTVCGGAELVPLATAETLAGAEAPHCDDRAG